MDLQFHCTCESSGYCPRYQRQMNSRDHQICKSEILTPEECTKIRHTWGSEVHQPPLIAQVFSFLKAQVTHLLTGAESVSQESYSQRLDICAACEFLNPVNGECNKCGCPVVEKAKMMTQDCPDKRWPPPIVASAASPAPAASSPAPSTRTCKPCNRKR